MLEDKDRIFKNLYNDLGSDLTSAQKRGDWVNTKEITEKGRDWIINEIKVSLNSIKKSIKKNGIIICISYHSLEEKIVKPQNADMKKLKIIITPNHWVAIFYHS